MQHHRDNTVQLRSKERVQGTVDGVGRVYVARRSSLLSNEPTVVPPRSVDGVRGSMPRPQSSSAPATRNGFVQNLEKLAEKAKPARVSLPSLAQSTYFDGIVRAGARAAVLLLVVFVNWFGLSAVGSTVSYFSDTETGGGMFVSGLLDLVTVQTGMTHKDLQCGGMLDFDFEVESTEGALDTEYSMSTLYAGMTDDQFNFCKELTVMLRKDGDTYYSGPLLALTTDHLDIYGNWRLLIELPEDALPADITATCPFDLVFNAWVSGAPWLAMGGFNDIEKLRFVVEKAPGCSGGGTCGDLNVHIENNNDTTIENDFDFNINTGGNNASGGGAIVTGDVHINLDLENIGAVNETNIDAGCGCCGCDCGTLSDCDNASAATHSIDDYSNAEEKSTMEETTNIEAGVTNDTDDTTAQEESDTDANQADEDVYDRTHDRERRTRER